MTTSTNPMASPISERPNLEVARHWSGTLLSLIERRSSAEAALQSHYQEASTSERKQHAEAVAALTAAYDSEQAETEALWQGRQRDVETRWQTVIDAFDASTQQRFRALEHQYETDRTAAEQRRQETEWLVGSMLDDQAEDSPLQRIQRLRTQISGTETELHLASMSAERRRIDSTAWLARCRMSTEPTPIEPPEPITDLTLLQERCLEAAATTEAPARQLRSMWLPRLFLGPTPYLLWIALTGALAGGAFVSITPDVLGISGKATDPAWLGILGVASGALSMLTLFILHVIANGRTNRLFSTLFAAARTTEASYSRWQKAARSELEAAEERLAERHIQRVSQRQDALSRAESTYTMTAGELATQHQSNTQNLQRAAHTERQQLLRERDEEWQEIVRGGQQARQELARRRTADFAMFATEHAQRLASYERERTAALLAAQADWATTLEALIQASTGWDHLQPTWQEWLDSPPPLTNTAPRCQLGTWRVRLADHPQGWPQGSGWSTPQAEWGLPFVFDRGERTGLLLQSTGPEGRRAALAVLQTALLRLMTTLPPGRLRCTIIDPVGLGEGFAAFMHLADVDELLVNQRIWTEPAAIEERLGDLTQHVETVLQMFLRNEFATLEEYNAQAGEVAEPYRVLVIAGLPTQFTDIALRRLWGIIAGGARCGVIPLIHVDLGQPLPRGFSLAEISEALVSLTWKETGFVPNAPELARWPLRIDTPPASEVFTAVVKAVGQRAGDVRRVEVPFLRVAPAETQYWTHSAAQGLSVPIGRAGATKSQSVTLGQGTSQHVLVAGKTGSGKSTMLHAFITNAALHYSPRELEFYLIDFKKGVEFQIYARQKLPHARVVAMESDREFGVSVLERLDAVLQERSAQFRAAGVPDLPSYRSARPNETMPRIVLVIDEFQEFFTEDDPLAQSAALLLDRLIRQGRAFGVHVMLGSQTLAGAYSLARSTLGQVAIRIALQCSETDAHLILSEDNTAARMLTRPGEAIYNDANGLPAGNHLFQVVWLDDATREQVLGALPERAARLGYEPPPAIIFEGNVPADPARLPPPNGHAGTATIWLGESVNLHGPLSLQFLPAVGFNLLLAGQDEGAALGVLAASVASLKRTGCETEAVWIANGSPLPQAASVWNRLATEWSAVRLLDQTGLKTQLPLLVEEIRRRDGQPGPRIWLCLYDMARFRKLRRKDDDYGFGGFDKKAASASDQLAEILRDGPSVGVHVWAWCDSVNTVSRWFSREMQGHFEQRIGFAMNATDSSQLLDSPVASRLGPNRAWLFRGDRGLLEKFRPYHPPATP